MYKINRGKVLSNTSFVNQIAMADVRGGAIAAVMILHAQVIYPPDIFHA